ncbi:pyridoxal phosphate-dependent transferase [Aspergillus pseudoustus]|uniref:Pyridoxal phosphate-dependent transferase n=1 Tax=Aspergillus pseudoustus TaxID=1810923 RepID=A0ABR4KEF5_9EURO
MDTSDQFGPSQRALKAQERGLAWNLMEELHHRPQFDRAKRPDGMINLSGALNSLMTDWMDEYVKEASQELKLVETLSYGSISGTPELLTAAATFFNTFFNPSIPINRNQILATNGVTSLIDLVAWSICNPGDTVLYPTPTFYMLNFNLAARSGVHTYPVSCTEMQDPFGQNNPNELISALEGAASAAEATGRTRCRMLVICNPANPQGRSYSHEALCAMAEFCARRGMHLVVDEIYALSQFEPQKDTPSGGFDSSSVSRVSSVLGVDTALALSTHSNVHCLYGLSKDFNLGGLRMGFYVTRNDRMLAAVKKSTWFTWVTNFSVTFATRFLQQTKNLHSYISIYQARLSDAYRSASDALIQHNIPFMRASAGLFIFVNLGKWLHYFKEANPSRGLGSSPNTYDKEMQLCLWLCDNGVFLNPGQFAESDQPGFFRLVFTAYPAGVIVLAIRRIRKALDKLEARKISEK